MKKVPFSFPPVPWRESHFGNLEGPHHALSILLLPLRQSRSGELDRHQSSMESLCLGNISHAVPVPSVPGQLLESSRGWLRPCEPPVLDEVWLVHYGEHCWSLGASSPVSVALLHAPLATCPQALEGDPPRTMLTLLKSVSCCPISFCGAPCRQRACL